MKNIPDRCVVYLLLVSHGALSSHHNLAAGLCLQLFGRQSTWAQDPPYKVELNRKHTHRYMYIYIKITRSNTRLPSLAFNRHFFMTREYSYGVLASVPLRIVHL